MCGDAENGSSITSHVYNLFWSLENTLRLSQVQISSHYDYSAQRYRLIAELAIPISYADAPRQRNLDKLRGLWRYRNLTYHLVNRNVASRYMRFVLLAGWMLLDALIHFSRDYVFDVTKHAHYIETNAPSRINGSGLAYSALGYRHFSIEFKGFLPQWEEELRLALKVD